MKLKSCYAEIDFTTITYKDLANKEVVGNGTLPRDELTMHDIRRFTAEQTPDGYTLYSTTRKK